MRIEFGDRTLELRQADITTLSVDAIVNAANSSLAGGGGVDGAIHRRGGPAILDECRAIGGCATGDAVATTAGDLDAKYVIHAVAPRYHGRADDALMLRSAYENALRRAKELDLTSVAFPSLGTGAYGYPVSEAAVIALETVTEHLRSSDTSIQTILFALFSDGDLRTYEQALASLTRISPPL